MVFTESGSFGVIVEGFLLINSISTTEPDMRVSSHPAPREGNDYKIIYMYLMNNILKQSIESSEFLIIY